MTNLPIKLRLPDHFLEPEVRCGYEVTEKLKKIWAVELDLLNKLLAVCKKYDIKVQVFAGTLLGAVRHKGMIPWDDDIDVALVREEFEKLLKVPAEEFEAPYFLQTAVSDQRHFTGYARLRNSKTTAAISGYEGADYNNGIYIDIFVLDGYGQNRAADFYQWGLQQLILKPIISYYYNGFGSIVHKIFYGVLKPLARTIAYETYVKCYGRILSMFNDKSVWFGLLTHERKVRRYSLQKMECADTILMPFEFLQVPAPRNYDKILTRIYGDYMKFPSPAQRGQWHENLIHFEPDVSYAEYFSR